MPAHRQRRRHAGKVFHERQPLSAAVAASVLAFSGCTAAGLPAAQETGPVTIPFTWPGGDARQKSKSSYIRLDYENATVELDHLYGYSDHNWTVTPAPGQDAVVGLWAQGEDHPSGHAAQYAAIVRSLQNGEPAPVSVTDAYATMELAAAIYASSVNGTTVCRGQIGEDSPFFTRMDGHLEPWKQEEALNA